MQIQMPDHVREILNTLSEHGYEAYAVGGCVRDSILGREPNDWDITTNALPHQVKALFRRTIDTGIQHGTVTIMIRDEGYEVTTYRVDGDYSDGRHPDSVEFSSSLAEDLKRRDFTINAMAYNDTDGLVDLFGGLEDMEQGVIRCVGVATDRFTEDALRLLRAIRFSAQLGFSIEEETSEAIRALAPTIAKVSRERIHTELGKTLLSKNPQYVGVARELGLMQVIIPEYVNIPQPSMTVEALLRALGNVSVQEADLAYRYATLLYPLGEKQTRQILKGLKLDNDTIEKASVLVRGVANCTPQQTEALIRKQASAYGAPMYGLIEKLQEEIAATIPQQNVDAVIGQLQASGEGVTCERTGTLARLWRAEREMFAAIAKRNDPLSVKELAISGNDLILMGYEPGRKLGATLQALLEEVLEDPSRNTASYLSERAMKMQSENNFA